MKRYLIAAICFSFVLTRSFAQSDSVLVYSQRALKCYGNKDYAGCLFWSEKMFDTRVLNYRSNYNLYRAAVSACQVNQLDKALAYYKEMTEVFLDFYNYPTFAADSPKLACISNTTLWKDAMAYMKIRYDSAEKVVADYEEDLMDTTKRLTRSILTDSAGLAKIAGSLSFEKLYARLKNYRSYAKAPQTNHWTLYQLKVNDTLTLPYLVYIPANYNPAKKTPLYVFLQGAVSNRREFSIDAVLFDAKAAYLQNPTSQNAFIIYPLARKDINWLYHSLAFKTIEQEIAFVKSLYNIDDNKVYATGHSDGGRGVFYFAINRSTSFASFLAINFFPYSPITNSPFRNLKNDKPFYGIVGAKDEIFPVAKVDSIYRYGRSIGDNWHNFVFDEGHDLPRDTPALIRFVYDTLLSKTRNPFSKSIEWETDNVENGRYQWLQITKLDTASNPQAWVTTYDPKVTVDNVRMYNFNRHKTGIVIAHIQNNEVTIQASRVTEMAFYLYPELVDLKKPIKFTVNNKTFFTVIPQPNKEDLMNEFVKNKDRTMLPVEKIVLAFDN